MTIFGFAYLFIPLITIVVFSFNNPERQVQHELERVHVEQLGATPFPSSDYTDAFVVSLQVAFVSCTLATILGALIALALARYRIHGGALWSTCCSCSR